MVLLACIHIIGLQLGGLLTDFLAIEGAVFCSRPVVIYVGGALGVGSFLKKNFFVYSENF